VAAAADLGEPLVASAPTCEASRALLAIARTVGAALAPSRSAVAAGRRACVIARFCLACGARLRAYDKTAAGVGAVAAAA